MWTPEQVAGVNNDVVEAPESLAAASSIVYTFAGNELITAFNNNPNLTNLRNDFSIWGERTTTAGAKIPVHIRFAINEKPVKYTSIYVEANNELMKQVFINLIIRKYGK